MTTTRKYVVSGQVTISIHIEVQASSEAEARELAQEAELMQLCNYCATPSPGEWSTSGELDGTPQITEVELCE